MPKSGQPWDPEFCRKRPLLRTLDPVANAFSGRAAWPGLADYTELVEAGRRRASLDLPPLEFFVPPRRGRRWRRDRVQVNELYDGSIVLDRRVPCLTESYHDLFNVLAFAAFPRSKRALHERQYRALEGWASPGARRLPDRRTREQDALTVFDEGGSVIVMTERDFAAWQNARNPTLAFAAAGEAGAAGEASAAGEAGVAPVLFGHALMEHVFYGRLAIRSCAVLLRVPHAVPAADALLDLVDRELALRLADPLAFQAPGADGVAQLDENGQLWIEART